MSYYSDVTILAGRKAYEILAEAWAKDGYKPSVVRSIRNEEFVFVQLQNREKIKNSELYALLRKYEFDYDIEEHAYALSAIVLHDNGTGEAFSNNVGAEIFADFDTTVCFVLPQDIQKELTEDAPFSPETRIYMWEE